MSLPLLDDGDESCTGVCDRQEEMELEIVNIAVEKDIKKAINERMLFAM